MDITTEINRILCLFRKKGDGSWIGKRGRSYFFRDDAPRYTEIVVNYIDQFSLGHAVGMVTDNYKIKEKDGFYSFKVHGVTFALRYHLLIKVVDFDLFDYDSWRESFHHNRELRYGVQGEAFAKKICHLLPVANETNWKERQYALLRYIKSGWTILDDKGNKVIFLPGDQDPVVSFCYDQQKLDPEIKWLKGTIVNTKVEKTPEEKMTEFKVELKALLAKYEMI